MQSSEGMRCVIGFVYIIIGSVAVQPWLQAEGYQGLQGSIAAACIAKSCRSVLLRPESPSPDFLSLSPLTIDGFRWSCNGLHHTQTA